MDPYDDSDHCAQTIGGSASALHQQTPPPPSIESMKVIKGFEFVTFTPTEIRPANPVAAAAIGATELSFEAVVAPDEDSVARIRTYSGSNSTTDTMVKSFDLDRMPENIATGEISNAAARDALHCYVQNKFCYGKKAANQMTIRDMMHSYVFQYSLESFCEKRQLCWTYEPYADACITFPESCSLSLPDNAWNIEVNEIKHLEWYIQQNQIIAADKERGVAPGPSAITGVGASSAVGNEICRKDSIRVPRGSLDLFQNKVINVIVPGTVSIHSCHNCGGIGRKRCTTCAGSGSKSCQTCTGNGYYNGGGYYHKSALAKSLESSDYCWRCHGRGRLRCYNCNGDGMLTCAACMGSGQIKCYIKLIVTLTNHKDTVLIRDHHSAEVPLDILNMADGDVVFEEEGHNLYHITNYIDESITRESERLIRHHENAYLRNSRLILQRHQVTVIPIAKVIAFWQRKQFHFYVFGSQQHRCYTANYPQKYACPCCCII